MPPASELDRDAVRAALDRAGAELLSRRSQGGYWLGELSSSALSTATAVTALAIVQRDAGPVPPTAHLQSGIDWLARHQNGDGGWGDTTRSLSNLSTTTLGWAAFGAVPGAEARHRHTVDRAEAWLSRHAGGVSPDQLAPVVIARYGKDRTFSVPILTLCALAGRLGAGPDAWRHVIPLPFELAALPHQLFAAVRLPVVSYALPALIAIGQVRHHHAPSPHPLVRFLRGRARARTLRILAGLQPENGGFLEATPLTSFVTMSLAGCGLADHIVARRGAEFLRRSQRRDGSWPIDTNLSTWVTTLAVNALGRRAADVDPGPAALRTWLLAQQYRAEHPYTHAAPGGWAWTNLPGGVPDSDDTAGALLALRQLGPIDGATRAAARSGLQWLLDLQNRDGGIPTFCRGWGTLPFDRSSADIAAHAISAWLAWEGEMPPPIRRRLLSATHRAIRFLVRAQRPDGSWLPLWFGNQFASGDGNPVYGTARVLCALADADAHPQIRSPVTARLSGSASAWLAGAQNADGGWGGDTGVASSTEETALAVEALAAAFHFKWADAPGALRRGVDWLVGKVADGTWTEPAPIGFYFAKLWYYEQLYPMIFTAGALRRVAEALDDRSSQPSTRRD